VNWLHKRWRLGAKLLTLAPIVILPSCDIVGKVCTTEFVYGISVTVLDSISGAGVFEGLHGYLLQPSYSEEMEVHGNDLVGAGERAGIYSVVVDASGYEPWVRTAVNVRQGDCHVVPVRLEALLVASGGP